MFTDITPLTSARTSIESDSQTNQENVKHKRPQVIMIEPRDLVAGISDNWEKFQARWQKLNHNQKEKIIESFNSITSTSPIYRLSFGEFLFEGQKEKVRERFGWMTK